MLMQARRGLRRATKDAVRLIDSTSVRLSSLSKDWATLLGRGLRRQGARRLRSRRRLPDLSASPPANVNDITAAKAMPIEPGATYVFDLGYYDYAGGPSSMPPAAGS